MLTSYANVKAILRLQNDNDQNLITNQLIPGAQGIIQRYTARDLLLNTYTRRFNGTGSNMFELPAYPIVSVGFLSVYEVAATPAPDSVSGGFLFDNNMLYFPVATANMTSYYFPNTNIFAKGIQNIKVTWTAGYSVIPPELDMACAQLAAVHYRELERIGLESFTLQGFETASIIKDEIPPKIRVTLNHYRRFGAYAF